MLIKRILLLLVFFTGQYLLAGCSEDSGDSDNKSSSLPDISGEWLIKESVTSSATNITKQRWYTMEISNNRQNVIFRTDNGEEYPGIRLEVNSSHEFHHGSGFILGEAVVGQDVRLVLNNIFTPPALGTYTGIAYFYGVQLTGSPQPSSSCGRPSSTVGSLGSCLAGKVTTENPVNGVSNVFFSGDYKISYCYNQFCTDPAPGTTPSILNYYTSEFHFEATRFSQTDDNNEPDDGMYSATQIQSGSTVTGQFQYDDDWFEVINPSNVTNVDLTVTLSSTNPAIVMDLVSGTTTIYGGYENARSIIVNTNSLTASRFVRVHGPGTGDSYSISVN